MKTQEDFCSVLDGIPVNHFNDALGSSLDTMFKQKSKKQILK